MMLRGGCSQEPGSTGPVEDDNESITSLRARLKRAEQRLEDVNEFLEHDASAVQSLVRQLQDQRDVFEARVTQLEELRT